MDTDRHQERLRAAPSHGIVLRNNDIPQLHKSWNDNITDLVSGIPLKLLRIHYQLLKCPEHFCEELSQKIERYTTAQW